jgi:hypothetical protein
MLMERMHIASTRNGDGEVLDVHGHGEEVSGYNNRSNRDRLTTGQVCSRWRVVRNEWGGDNNILEVHRCGEGSEGVVGYSNVSNQDRLMMSQVYLR